MPVLISDKLHEDIETTDKAKILIITSNIKKILTLYK